MKPGEAAITFVRGRGGTPEATVITTDIRTSAINAAIDQMTDMREFGRSRLAG